MAFRMFLLLTFLSVLGTLAAPSVREPELSLDITVVTTPHIGSPTAASFGFPGGATRMASNRNFKGEITYSMGERVEGDSLIGHGTASYKYPTLQDVSVGITYPKANTPARTITYVDIVTHQSSDKGQAYIAEGGIGQKRIKIIVTAQQTLHFSYDITFYGMD